MTSVAYYAAMADRMERDPINGPNGRLTVPYGRGFALWRRMNPMGDLVWLEVDGKDAWLTRRQADLLDLLQTFSDGQTLRMRDLAAVLSVSPSTVSRGMVKLASMGLVTYVTSRGRHGATIVYRMVGEQFADVRKRFREAAKAKVRAWSKASLERVSRLWGFVASYETWKEVEAHGYLSHYLLTKDATLVRPWTEQELREIVGA